MKIKHTPGKWIKQKNAFGNDGELRGIAILDETGSPISYTIINRQHPNGEAEANAKLIASAPELLQMVKDLKNCIGRLTEQEQPDKALEAYWIGEAHELLLEVNGGNPYWKNANEKES